jgi:hypothetical protein
MAIHTKCGCGKVFSVKEEFAGKRAKCPDCGGILTIGDPKRKPRPTADKTRPAPGASARASTPQNAPQLAQTAKKAPPPIARPLREQPASATAVDNALPVVSTGDSPLDAIALAALKDSEMLRRRIRYAALFLRFGFLFGLVVMIGFALLIPAAILLGGTAPNDSETLVMFVFAIVQIGTLILLHYAWKATWNCQQWAPLTMFILYCCGAGVYLLFGLVAAGSARGGLSGFSACAVVAIVFGLVALFFYRAWEAIPRFRSQPQWCQDALLYCNL